MQKDTTNFVTVKDDVTLACGYCSRKPDMQEDTLNRRRTHIKSSCQKCGKYHSLRITLAQPRRQPHRLCFTSVTTEAIRRRASHKFETICLRCLQNSAAIARNCKCRSQVQKPMARVTSPRSSGTLNRARQNETLTSSSHRQP
jgi:hypothetical protein